MAIMGNEAIMFEFNKVHLWLSDPDCSVEMDLSPGAFNFLPDAIARRDGSVFVDDVSKAAQARWDAKQAQTDAQHALAQHEGVWYGMTWIMEDKPSEQGVALHRAMNKR